LSAKIDDNFSVGISARYIKGNTDDYEYGIGRGVLWFFGDYNIPFTGVSYNGGMLRVDSVDYSKTISGTSKFSGYEYTISGLFKGKNITLGFAVTPPITITREYSGTVRSDTAATREYTQSDTSYTTSYTDKIKLPWKGMIGLGLSLRQNITLTLEYEYCGYSLAKYSKDNVTSNRWLDASSIRVGMEYLPLDWLALRVGFRAQDEVFEAQNNALSGSPVWYSAYSAGVGVKLPYSLSINIAYEYYESKYEDMWATNNNINTKTVNNIALEILCNLNDLLSVHL
jgi:hypothetical protein